jgi:hypothetical protein
MIGAECSVKWPNPARPGDTLTVHGEVTEVKPSQSRPDRGTISISAETRNQRDEVLQILTATLLVPRRSEPNVLPAPLLVVKTNVRLGRCTAAGEWAGVDDLPANFIYPPFGHGTRRSTWTDDLGIQQLDARSHLTHRRCHLARALCPRSAWLGA